LVDPAWVALGLVSQIGGVRLRALVAAFGSPAAALNADVEELQQVHGIGEKTALAIRAVDVRRTEAAIARWQVQGIVILPFDHHAYPTRLQDVEDAPPTLFVRGDWDAETLARPTVAVVGTRTPSPTAIEAAGQIAYMLVERGCNVVSGLALGIDGIAHQEAIAAQGYTLAVLGGGMLPPRIYPPANRALAAQVARCGALVSEQHPQAESKATYLVARNRIITGLCSAVVVVETETNGGAMHAARRALAQGRALYTLDLPASGNQALLAAGAGMVIAERDGMGIAL
jgi:DNA processing protein